jgi:ABC-type Fe3+/spermidine/putrescine transport system ATPase subunit
VSVEVRGLGVALGEFSLAGVDLSLGAGEYWVLLGPSGCGKSVLLLTLAGLRRPDGGRIEVDGRDVTATPPERRDFGLVFQHAALFPHYDVRGNIEYGLRARRVPAAERRRRADEVIAGLGLTPIVGRPVATLSGGEAQRVAIARALAIRPRLLLLDEPLSLLDHNARLELTAELRRVHRAHGLTTLHVTHSRDEARALGDHLAVMLGGRIAQAGAADAVWAQPRCGVVAEFLGCDPASAATAPACAAACRERPGRCSLPARGAP